MRRSPSLLLALGAATLAFAWQGCGTHDSLDLAYATTPPVVSPTPTPTALPSATPPSCPGPGTICGFGVDDANGDGGPASSARFDEIEGLFSSGGTVWIADHSAARIRRVDAGGTIHTIVGNGVRGPTTVGVAGTTATLAEVGSVVVAPDGWVFWNDWTENVVYGLDPATGLVEKIAGGGANGTTDNLPPTSAAFLFASQSEIGLGPLPQTLLIADTGNSILRAVNLSASTVTIANVTISPHSIRTFAGVGNPAFGGNGGPAINAAFRTPNHALALPDGRIVISDFGNARLRIVGTDGIVQALTNGGAGSLGDGGPAQMADASGVCGTVYDAATSALHVASFSNWERVVNLSVNDSLTFGGVSVAAQSIDRTLGVYGGSTLTPSYEIDGSLARKTTIGTPYAPPALLGHDLLAVDGDRSVIRRVDQQTGTQSIWAGGGTADRSKILEETRGILVDGTSGVLLSSAFGARMLRLGADGSRTVVAGQGTTSLTGDGGNALSSGFYGRSLARAPDGSVVVADSVNHVLRRFALDGTIAVIAGTGVSGGTTGTGNAGSALASTFSSNGPSFVAVDSAGNIFVVDADQVRAVNTTNAPISFGPTTIQPGDIDVIANLNNSTGLSGENAPARNAPLRLNDRSGIAATDSIIYISDSGNNRIRGIDRVTGTISTFAGTGATGLTGDGGAASAAKIGNPRTLIARNGQLYWFQTGAIRSVDFGGATVHRVAGYSGGNEADFGDLGLATAAGIMVDGFDVAPDGSVYLSGAGRVRRIVP